MNCIILNKKRISGRQMNIVTYRIAMTAKIVLPKGIYFVDSLASTLTSTPTTNHHIQKQHEKFPKFHRKPGTALKAII